jgi:hypothetical protein
MKTPLNEFQKVFAVPFELDLSDALHLQHLLFGGRQCIVELDERYFPRSQKGNHT